MSKLKIGLLALLLGLSMSPSINNATIGVSWGVSQAEAEEKAGMTQVQLIMKKLRASMASMKDFDELEGAGMAKSDVDRMRRAMKQKIEKLTAEAVDLIRAL